MKARHVRAVLIGVGVSCLPGTVWQRLAATACLIVAAGVDRT